MKYSLDTWWQLVPTWGQFTGSNKSSLEIMLRFRHSDKSWELQREDCKAHPQSSSLRLMWLPGSGPAPPPTAWVLPCRHLWAGKPAGGSEVELYIHFLGRAGCRPPCTAITRWQLKIKEGNKNTLIYREEPSGSDMRTGFHARFQGSLRELEQVISDFRVSGAWSIEMVILLPK